MSLYFIKLKKIEFFLFYFLTFINYFVLSSSISLTKTNTNIECKSWKGIFCTKVEDHPSEKLESAIQKYFGKLNGLIEEYDIETSYKDGHEEEHLCNFETSFSKPYGAIDVSNTYRNIAFTQSDTVQIHQEICIKDGEIPEFYKKNKVNLLKNYTPICKQFYTKVSLVTWDMNENNNEIQFANHTFRVPTCCKFLLLENEL